MNRITAHSMENEKCYQGALGVKRPFPSGAKRPQANTGSGRFAPFVSTAGDDINDISAR